MTNRNVRQLPRIIPQYLAGWVDEGTASIYTGLTKELQLPV